MMHFLKIALRNLARNRVYTFISVAGLAMGISCSLLIAMYTIDELGYDKHHEKRDRIYRLTSVLNFNGELSAAITNMPTAPVLRDEYPEVENFVRFKPVGQDMEFSVGDKLFLENNVWLADSTLFDVFSYNVLAGNADNALTAPKSIVLSQKLAARLYGDQDPVGEQVRVNNTLFNVTAVIADPPSNSEIPINAVFSMSTMPPAQQEAFNQDWFRIGFYTYLLLREGTDVQAFEDKLVAFEKKHVQPWAEANHLVAGLKYELTPLNKLHFDTGRDYDRPKGNIGYIFIFILLAVFILAIASINYINLSLAQGAKRAKEVGIRKTLGAQRWELVFQFMGESVLITLIATLIGLTGVELLMGSFNNLTGKGFDMGAVLNAPMLLTLLGIVLAVGLIAGSYPALILSAFQPVRVLKGIVPREGAGSLNKALILVQFAFSLFMITGTILIDDQMDYMRAMNLGFDRENLISINLPMDTAANKAVQTWVGELRTDSRIKAVSMTNLPTGKPGELMFRVEQDGELREQAVDFMFVDRQFIEVLGLELLQGRNFDENILTDERQAFIVNETAARTFGWDDQALGKRVQWGLMANNQAENDGVVVGVVNDFHFKSLHNALEPVILCFNPAGANTLSIRLQKGDYQGTLASLQERWKEIAPRHDFNFSFMDDLLQKNYGQEQAMNRIFNYFAVVSVLIASLGLFALLSFTIQCRIKEIGVRKVLGASVPQLSWILVRDFFLLLLLAFALTTPVSIYLMRRWLEDFAYDVPLDPLSFVLSITLAVMLAALTVSYHVFRISRTDPVNALRYE